MITIPQNSEEADKESLWHHTIDLSLINNKPLQLLYPGWNTEYGVADQSWKAFNICCALKNCSVALVK